MSIGTSPDSHGSRLPAAVLAAALALAPAAARANNGLALLGQGARSVGRGGAEVAVGGDVLASTSNPATLMEIPRIRIDGSVGALYERVRSTDRFEDDLATQFFAPIPAIGVVWDPLGGGLGENGLPLPPSRLRLAFSAWQPVLLVFSPTVSVAAQATDTLAFGLSLHALLTRMSFTIRGRAGGDAVGAEPDFLPKGKVRIHRRPDGTPVDPPEPFDGGTGTPLGWDEIFLFGANTSADSGAPPPTIEIELRNVTGAGLAGQIGVLFTPFPALAVGASWRSPGIVWNPHGEGKIDLSKAVKALEANPQVRELLDAALETYLPKAGRDGFAATYAVSSDSVLLPPVLAVGLAFAPLERLLFALDVKWIQWTVASSRIRLHGQRGSNADFNEINGGRSIDYTVRIDWEDQLVIAAGTAFAATDWLILRAGFNHGNNPISKDYLLGNSLGTEDHATAGLGFRLGGWDLDFAYVYGFPTRIRADAAAARSTSEQHWAFFSVGYQF